MLLIVAHHYVVNSGLTSAGGPIQSNPLSWRSIFLLLIGAWGKTGINCFVLITGYFMCKSKITIEKFIKLFAEIVFYGIIINIIFALTGQLHINSLKDTYYFLASIIPINGVNTGFTSCFLLFYLLIPFLNVLIAHITDKQHILLIALLVVIYVIFGTVKLISFNYVEWFCVLYIIAAYMRLYPKEWMSGTRRWGLTTLGLIIMCSISVVVCAWIKSRYDKLSFYFFVSDSNTLLATAFGISSFLFFKNLKMPYNKVINTVAASTFGVLCIHANSDTMRRWLWRDLLHNIETYYSSFMPLIVISEMLCVFIVCTIVDMLRIRLIEKPFMIWLDGYEIYIKQKWKDCFGKFVKSTEVNPLYESDPNKNNLNKHKHSVSFDDAYIAINDPYALFFLDPYPDEVRYRAIGRANAQILFVIFTERSLDRIISARYASPSEEAEYYRAR